MLKMTHARLCTRHGLFLTGLGLAALALLRLGPGSNATRPITRLPQTMLWAWERPEDLRFLSGEQTGVAFLAGTVLLRGEAALVRPRLQPLHVAPGTALMAVVRIEPDAMALPALTAAQRTQAAAAIVELATRPGVLAVQVDYDAPASQREFYGELLRDLRPRLPNGVPLSITALASWCLSDNWLDSLPVDEAVPMLFQMGADNRAVRQHLMQGRDFRTPLCRSSLGLATNEPVRNLPSGRRVYWWSARAWTVESVQSASVEDRP